MKMDGILQLVSMMGIEKVRKAKTYVLISCPIAPISHENGVDRTPSLGIRVSDEGQSFWRCFACGKRGSLKTLAFEWALATSKDHSLVLDLIDREEDPTKIARAFLDTKEEADWGKKKADEIDWEVWDDKELKQFVVEQIPQYAIDRGISVETYNEWELGYDRRFKSEDGSLRPRIIFPIRRKDGKLVGIIGRATDNVKEEKYYNYWRFNKSHYLYGQHKVAKRNFVVVVEGMLDVLKWFEYAIPTVGIIGSSASDKQIALILDYERVYLALDKDRSGMDGTGQLEKKLKDRVPVFTVSFPSGKIDPKQLTMDEAWKAVETAKRVW